MFLEAGNVWTVRNVARLDSQDSPLPPHGLKVPFRSSERLWKWSFLARIETLGARHSHGWLFFHNSCTCMHTRFWWL